MPFKHIVAFSIALILSVSSANAQLKISQVAKFEHPNKRGFRLTGGREVKFTDDGSKLIASFYGSTVQLFDLETNESIVGPIQTSGDGEIGFVSSQIAYTADWRSVRLWDTNSGDQIGDAIPHVLREDSIIHPAVSPQGKFIATRTTMNSVQLCDVATREQIGKQRNYPTQVHTIRFSDDGKLLIVRAGKSIYAIDSKTGQSIAGPIKSEWQFQYFSQQQKLVTTEQTDGKLNQLVIRSSDQEGWPEKLRLDLPGKLKRITALNGNQILLQATKTDYTPAMFIISLDKPETRIDVESDADRAFGVIISPDNRYWICSNIRDISCQKFGESKPVWLNQIEPSGFNQKLSILDNEYFIIRDKQENFGIYKIEDGSNVWRKTGVKRFSVNKNKIAICNSNGIEVWGIGMSR